MRRSRRLADAAAREITAGHRAGPGLAPPPPPPVGSVLLPLPRARRVEPPPLRSLPPPGRSISESRAAAAGCSRLARGPSGTPRNARSSRTRLGFGDARAPGRRIGAAQRATKPPGGGRSGPLRRRSDPGPQRAVGRPPIALPASDPSDRRPFPSPAPPHPILPATFPAARATTSGGLPGRGVQRCDHPRSSLVEVCVAASSARGFRSSNRRARPRGHALQRLAAREGGKLPSTLSSAPRWREGTARAPEAAARRRCGPASATRSTSPRSLLTLQQWPPPRP